MKLHINKEKLFSLTITLEILLPACKYFIIQSIPNLYVYNDLANYIISIFMAPLILLCLVIICNNIHKKTGILMLTVILFILPVLYTFIFYNENSRNLIEVLPRIITVSLPMFLISSQINKEELLYDCLRKSSYIVVLFLIFMQMNITLYGNVGAYNNTYSMSLGYYSIVPLGLIFSYYINKRRKIDLFIFAVGCVIVLISGSRGALLSIMIFTVILYFKTEKLTYKKMLILISIVIVTFFCIVFLNNIIDYFIFMLDNLNISSRTLVYIKNGYLTNMSTRRAIQLEILNELAKLDMFGNGVLWQNRAHNIMIENIFSYGFIIGIILNICLIGIVFKTIFGKYNKLQYYLLIIFMSYAIVDSMLNLTVWGKDIFWIYLGLFSSFTSNYLKRRKD